MALRRSLVSIGLGALLAISVASPSFAYGKENWQTTFAGTAVTPGGTSFGFWGWCTFGGGVTSGTNGDCEFAEYVHNSPQGSFTCQESLDISAWHIGPGMFPSGDFIISGTATVHPSALTAPCLAFFPGTTTTSFSNADSGIPGAAGHSNLNSLLPFLFGTSTGEFQLQVTQLP